MWFPFLNGSIMGFIEEVYFGLVKHFASTIPACTIFKYRDFYDRTLTKLFCYMVPSSVSLLGSQGGILTCRVPLPLWDWLFPELARHGFAAARLLACRCPPLLLLHPEPGFSPLLQLPALLLVG